MSRSGGGRRGAASNPAGRFERFRTEALPEDSVPEEPGSAPPGPATQITMESTRRIITRNDSPDIPFDRSINPYKGCEHGCVYCFARPTHAFLGLSPGLDFETRIVAKPQGPARLREELARPGYRCDVMALGSNTDPYQPAERRLRITREILEVLREHDHPVSIVTKSSLILRDLDLLAPMAARRLASVMISVTTLDPDLALRMEPRAAAPARRLETMRALNEAGVPAGVLASPMIPGLNDAEMERILEAASRAGARAAGWILLRLPHELKGLFEEWLRAHYPLRADHVLSLIRATREGALNDPAFGSRMRGRGPYADLLARRFRVACGRLGLGRQEEGLDTSLFRQGGGAPRQATLFGE